MTITINADFKALTDIAEKYGIAMSELGVAFKKSEEAIAGVGMAFGMDFGVYEDETILVRYEAGEPEPLPSHRRAICLGGRS